MTEVPEHLLRRSKERRAALGLDGGGGDGGDGAPPPPPPPAAAASGADEPNEIVPSGAGPGDGAVPATTASSPPPDVMAPAPTPLAPYVRADITRPKIPRWAVPVLAALPLWAIIYAGSLTVVEPGITDPVLLEGEEIYSAQCSSCHAAAGGGGIGRPLNNGEVVLTFPDRADHVAWVVNGSPAAGTRYGAEDRPGGQHVSQDNWGPMPAFGGESGTLTEEQILAVVRYEREIIGGATEETLASGENGGEAGLEPSADTPGNEASSDGGNVGGEGGDGSSSDAGPGGGDSGDEGDLDSQSGSSGGEEDTTG